MKNDIIKEIYQYCITYSKTVDGKDIVNKSVFDDYSQMYNDEEIIIANTEQGFANAILEIINKKFNVLTNLSDGSIEIKEK